MVLASPKNPTPKSGGKQPAPAKEKHTSPHPEDVREITEDIALNNLGETILFVSLMLAAALLAWVLYSYFVRAKRSEVTKKSVGKTLRTMAPLREWRVLENVTLADKKGNVTADHLVIAPYGVLVFTDIHQQGSYYGELRDEQWLISTGGENQVETLRVKVPSPVRNNERFVAALRARLTAGEVYNVPVEALCPVTQSKAEVFVTGANALVVPAGRLREVLSRQKYQKDNGVDTGKIAALLQNS